MTVVDAMRPPILQKALGKGVRKSGVTMPSFKMRMTGQQSDYFFVYIF
jgi:hypothetical protein